ncbi:hypothetical protein LOAG_16867 [Loa loa]|nr:hypothetical protein LOAG_16867 [Loa loa]EJD76130.1 hypothetical protein LOAG_16867 [Loa loa]
MKRVDAMLTSGSEKESEEAKARGKLSFRRKPEKELLQDRGRKDKILEGIGETKRSASTSATLPENEISETDEKDGLTGEEKKRIAMIAKSGEKMVRTKVDVRPTKYNMKIKDLTSTTTRESDRIRGNDRKIMRVFIQKKGKVHDMTTAPKRVRYTTDETAKTKSDTTQGPVLKEMDSLYNSISAAESESSEEREMMLVPNKIKEKEVMNEISSSNVASSSTDTPTSCSDQDAEFSTQKLKCVKDNGKATMTASPADMNIDAKQSEPNEPQDRSYADGLAQIRTILEIYGTEEEKTEAFNKLLDEDVSISEKEIVGNLRKAVCDLPMNTELLEKVLNKMQNSGLLKKQEHKTLQKNLVPQAVNESVTIALLAQVLQRQKLKKSTS